eukprot:TRINITY_DN25876_c0_g1_i2.p4 TRINITY_DN25876_c0_g1~~TRINITY_DN25876_c0_g1_i2.p4  ORF type:complete len:114 (-),score=4.86 TRINITY_DN25876_c0_g1_i2:885-1226(-)
MFYEIVSFIYQIVFNNFLRNNIYVCKLYVLDDFYFLFSLKIDRVFRKVFQCVIYLLFKNVVIGKIEFFRFSHRIGFEYFFKYNVNLLVLLIENFFVLFVRILTVLTDFKNVTC